MSLLMMRAAILAQGAVDTAPPVTGSAWELDVTRRPAGYTLSDGNRTAINTAGGSGYQRWVPTARAILPSDGRRYWELRCAASGAASFAGHMGVVSQVQRDGFGTGLDPITQGSIGWRGNGTLWSSDTASPIQPLTGLPGFGAGDVLMFVLDPVAASLWIGRNGIWHSDPASGAPTWTAGGSPAFHPQVQGSDPGDGGTLRALASEFSYPVPPGVLPLGYQDPDLAIRTAETWRETGGGAALSAAQVEFVIEQGGGPAPTAAQAALYIETEIP